MKIKDIIKDQYGILYSSELLLSIILLIFIIGVIANLSDGLNERMISEEEFSSLETIAIESSDYLLNNPGNPENWEDDEGLKNGIVSKNIIPGLAIKNKNVENGEFFDESASDEMIMSNAISYNKLIKIKNNYDSLVDSNLLNDSVISSMAIYPLNSEIKPIEMGYDFEDKNDNVNDNNIVTVNRTVKCDFYSNFVVYSNDGRSLWLCKNFRVYKESLDEYNYYLISDESVKDTGTYWILESLNRTSENKEIINQEVIDLNPFLMEDLGNSSDEIYSIHFNVPKNRVGDFKTVLVAIPKNMTDVLISNDELNYDYFKVQDVNFILKIGYK